MSWGGSLNEKGSDYLRKIREADRVVKFLENLKEHLSSGEIENISQTVDIIVKYISNISENPNKDSL
jgi:predicted RNA-binding protein with EMAP domain